MLVILQYNFNTFKSIADILLFASVQLSYWLMVLRNAVLLLVLKSSQIQSRSNKCKQRAAVITVTYCFILNLIPLITPFL